MGAYPLSLGPLGGLPDAASFQILTQMDQRKFIGAENALGAEQNHHNQNDGVHQHGIGEDALDGGGQCRHPSTVFDLVIHEEHNARRDHGSRQRAHAAQNHHHHHEGGVQNTAVGEGKRRC